MTNLDGDGLRLRRLRTTDLTVVDLAAIRDLMDVAFDSDDEEERFTDEDWEHSVGGTHVVLDRNGVLVAHASVVERPIEIDGRRFRTGYMEAVATAPAQQGRGHGTTVVTAATELIRAAFELGVLGTGAHHFYERLGWETWTGQAFVRTPEGLTRTPDEEGFLLVLRTPTSPGFDLSGSISCDWRPGDVW